IILMLLGLDYALVIGVSLAIFGVIPFVGFIITAIPALLIAAGQDGGPGPLWVLIVFIAVQQFDGFFIQPKIVGESVGLHPLTVIFSVLCWSLLIGGILGALLAVPLTASIKVLFRRYVWENKIKNKFGEKIEASPT
ncbi:MAG: AI-2E family transporter, partial [Verrucomicrobiota bacterium]|nr:AI-2E family transporter [Verrucomicrobiota bacterium]